MGGSTRPDIIFSPAGQLGSHGIAFHITDGVPEMSVAQDAGIEAILPEMSGDLVFSVEVVGVEAVKVVQAAGESLYCGGDGQVVDVIGHQAVGVEADSVAAGILQQFRKVDPAIRVVSESEYAFFCSGNECQT